MAALLACLGAAPVFGQVPEGQENAYIEKTFQALIGEAPQMGWFVPQLGFVGQQDSGSVFIFGSLGRPIAGRKNGPLSAKEVRDIRNSYWLACEMEEKDQLSSYHIGEGEIDAGRGLYTGKKVPGNIRSGLVSIPLDAAALAKINARLGWPSRGVLRRDEAIGVDSQSAYYSLHKLWDSKSGKLSRQAIVLHSRTGLILAQHAQQDLEEGLGCDACGRTTYWERRPGEDIVLNMFELLSPELEMSEFRVYEYVVHCR